MTISQTLTPFPAAVPQKGQSQAVFNANYDAVFAFYTAHLAELPVWQSEANATQSEINSLAATLTGMIASISSGAANAVPYNFSTTITDADPGAGNIRFNNATQNATTVLRLDLTGLDGVDWTGVIDSWDDSTSTIKGQLMVMASATPTKWIAFNLVSIASPAGYRNITVTVVAASPTPFTNGEAVVVKFTAKGDKGDTGATGAGGITSVTTSASAITLTSTRTMAVMTPADFGVTVKMPDATTMPAQSPAHIIVNKGLYPVRVVDAAAKLLGFVPPLSTTEICLTNNTTAAGVWGASGLERGGVSLRVSSTSLGRLSTANDNGAASVELDGDIEILLSPHPTTGHLGAVAYKKSNGQMGAIVTVRAANVGTTSTNNYVCVKDTTTQALVVSAIGTALETVVLSVNPSTLVITVNTMVATTTASSYVFTADSGLMAFPTVARTYVMMTIGGKMRAVSVSGTVPTVGAEVSLTGSSPLGNMTTDKVVTMAFNGATDIRYEVWTVSGTTLTAGTPVTHTPTTLNGTRPHFFPLGSRWCSLFLDGTTANGLILSLAGTVLTKSSISLGIGVAINGVGIIGSNKVLVLSEAATTNLNILTDTAGTASAGTAITGPANDTHRLISVLGNTAVTWLSTIGQNAGAVIDCAGASPVLVSTVNGPPLGATIGYQSTKLYAAADAVASGSYFSSLGSTSGTAGDFISRLEVNGDFIKQRPSLMPSSPLGTTRYRGPSNSIRWATNHTDTLVRLEIAP